MATRSLTASGNAYIDGVLQPTQWDNATNNFSFPALGTDYNGYAGSGEENTTGFQTFTTTQKNAARAAISIYSELVAPPFAEVTEVAGSPKEGNIRWGRTTDPDNVGSSAFGYYPSIASKGGDLWFHASNGNYTTPIPGDRGYFTFMHELGHGMGLKHSHENLGAPWVAIPSDRDAFEYTIMTYRSYIGGGAGWVTAGYNHPLTPMLNDVMALQYSYGPNTTIRASGCTISINATTMAISINGVPWITPGARLALFCLPWCNGGDVLVDATGFTSDMNINMTEGMPNTLDSTTVCKMDGAGGHPASGNFFRYFGSVWNQFAPGSGNNTIVGDANAGGSTLYLSGNRADYFVEIDGFDYIITDLRGGTPNGVCQPLTDIEFVRFADGTQDKLDLIEDVDDGDPDFIFNIAKGAIAEKVRDSSSSLLMLFLKTSEADDTLKDYDTIAAMLAGSNVEADFTNYARKTSLTGSITVDDTNNRVDVDVADQTWVAAGGASNNTLKHLIVACQESGSDSGRIPLTAHRFPMATNGTNITVQVNASGFYRAA